MQHPDSAWRGPLWWGMLTASLVSLAGCVNPQTRFQSAEETERENDLRVPIIRDVVEVANIEPQAVHGVGLVTDLEGTGGSSPGGYRSKLEEELRKQKVEHVKALLESPNNALVLVTATIPPGARKGDPIDVEVTLPPGSPATSLRGGYLQDCVLRNYETKANLSPEKHSQSNQLLPGHILARAKGPLLVGLGQPDEPAELRRGRIWGGGVSLLDRNYLLALKKDRQFASVANAVAQRLNGMFHDDPQRRMQAMETQRLFLLKGVTDEINESFQTVAVGGGETAKTYNKDAVLVRVPYGYRLNQERYLRALFIPLQMDSGEQMSRYRKRLHKMLCDPKDTMVAALRLEALGKESMAAFKEALKDDSPLVRFCAAEALTYLGSTVGVEELARIARQHPEVRAYALTALASLNESVSQHRLSELLAVDDPELRCGAFRALRLMLNSRPLQDARLLEDPHYRGDPAVRLLGAEPVQDIFWVHRVAPKTKPLVYFGLSKRAEVVLFGDDTYLVPPIRIPVGADITVTADVGDERSATNPHGRCTISRFIADDTSVKRQQCSLRLDDVLHTLAELGGGYPEAVDLLRKADDLHRLSCPVCLKLPDADSVEALAEHGRDPEFLKE